ncbi:MAG: short-chain dehydrogenase [bacterium TMED88]|nr:short-chain dehydrogenase [Deltaproteobacteria bacterium]OUV19466.1 MAG: short-chain dehydrogenase [bacterium TMED88]
MDQFEGKIAVITGGGTGMGRELCVQLAREGAHIAMCDVLDENMQQTKNLCEAVAPSGTRISTHIADVSIRSDVVAFRDAVREAHESSHINLLFNNAGIGGGGSFVDGDIEEWEKTFEVCWNGVYLCCRAFMPLLLASQEGHVINTSSVNGLWASIGPATAHTAYSSAKFAVRGFTEALINDFKLNAPHLRASIVMPGHIGTSIVINSGKILGRDPKELPEEALDEIREQAAEMGFPVENLSNEQIRQFMMQQGEMFRDAAPMNAETAATIILDGVRANRWRILVGEDASVLDEMIRARPEEAYEEGFYEELLKRTGWALGEMGRTS